MIFSIYNKKVHWSNELSLGISCIDDDHKSFFDISDMVFESIEQNSEYNELFVIGAISILKEGVAGHFLREEISMRTASYAAFDRHKKEHDEFIEHFSLFSQSLIKNKTGTPQELLMFFQGWFAKHIREFDKPLINAIPIENIDSRLLAELAWEAIGTSNDEFVDDIAR